MSLTLQQRAEAYGMTFRQFPASHLRVVEEAGGPVLYGIWLIGNDYANASGFYGSYPPGYLARVMALFPDAPLGASERSGVLHVFSGSLPPGPYTRLDIKRDDIRKPEYVGDVCQVKGIFGERRFTLVLADPPYSADDAVEYGTPMVNRGTVLAELAKVVTPGGHLVWLDTVWPMFRKAEWRTVGRIALVRSTNHRVRLISIFERQAA